MKKFVSFLLVLTIVCAMGSISFTSFAKVDNTIYSTGDEGETATVDTSNQSETATESSTADTVSEPKETTESTEVTTEATEPTDSTVATTEPTKETEATKPTATQPTTKPTQPPVKKVYPKNIKTLKVTERTTNSISLKWSASKNHTRYVLFRGYEKSDGKVENYRRYKDITNEKKQTFTDKNLKSGRIYKYKIYACRKTKDYTTYSNPTAVVTTTKMEPVENVKVDSAKSSKISISWSKVQGAKKYYVYRRTPNSDYSLIAKRAKLNYTDKKVTPSTDYIYRVQGYRKVQDKTYVSPNGFVAATAGVAGVGGVTAKSYLKRALITWSPAQNVSGYDIFYINSNGDYKLKATKTYPAYLSGKCTPGKTYRFAIKAFKSMSGQKIYSNSKIVDVNITNQAYGQTAKGTYVEICTETQEMYMYVNDKQYCHTNVVTGNYGSHDTTHGYHKVISKSSPARLRGSSGGSSWDVMVKYWLGFTYDGQGIHDSTWRPSTDYGKQTYKGNGSHGCVNTPISAVGKMYSKAYIGMPIIVY